MEDERFESIRREWPPTLNTRPLALPLDLNPRTVLNMAADGRLPARRLPGSRKLHFFREDVLATLRKHMLQPGEAEPPKES